MPRPRRKPTLRQRLEMYKRAVMDARVERDERRDEWKMIQRLYYSEPVFQFFENENVQVNLIYSYVETIMPSLVFNNPTLSATPLNAEAQHALRTTEAVVSSEFRSDNLRDKLMRATLDMLLKGIGILQIGFYGGGLVPEGRVVGESDEPQNERDSRRRSSDLPYGLRPNRLYILDHRPQNFLKDPVGVNSDLSDSLWCAIEYTRRLEEVQRDPQYENTSDLQGNAFNLPPGSDDIEQHRAITGRINNKDIEFVRLVQYWDIVDRSVWTFSMEHDRFLRRDKWDLPSKRFPFYVLKGTEDTERFWCQSPIWPWTNLVSELDFTLSSRLAHINKFVRKYVYDKDKVDEDDLQKLVSGEDGTLIGVSTEDKPLSEIIQPLIDANISPDSYAFTAEIFERFQWISGISPFDMGATRPGERPAAEINRLSAGSNARRQGLASRIARPLTHLARDATSVIRKYYTDEDVVRVVDDDGDLVWLNFTGSSLSTEYLWEVSIEDIEPTTRSGRLQRAMEILQIALPLGQGALGIVDLVPLIRDVFHELGMKNVQFLPEAQAAARDPGHEWFLIREKGRELEPSPAEDLMLHLHTHTEQVRAELQKPPEEQKSAALKVLLNHLEMTKGLLQARLDTMQGFQATQQPAAGPGQGIGGGAPAGNQNNTSGLGGPFAGNAGPIQGPDLTSLLQGIGQGG